MKSAFIALVVTLMVSASAVADEKIQLAAAIGSGAAVQPTPEASGAAAGAAGAAEGTAAAAGGVSTGTMVTVGVIAAAGLAAIANSGSSSSH
ncbi:MAG: hypothetical protein L0Z73_16420 [Gammaproteobacteria bacterium]|nr:hypothetical protein [Gammaproteobacteria bacterium]